MSAGKDMSAGVATEEAQGVAQGFAQDVASIVCKHLENHRLGQLDMKVVLERQLSNRQKTQKRVEAIPFRAGIMGNAVHWYVLQPLPDPDVLCSWDSAPTSSMAYALTLNGFGVDMSMFAPTCIFLSCTCAVGRTGSKKPIFDL